MSKESLDLLIIADKGGYQNVAFMFQFANLAKDGHIMTIQNLEKYFADNRKFLSSENAQDEPGILTFEQSGKLNGLYLYDYCTKRGIRCGLTNAANEKNEDFIQLMDRNPKCIAVSTTWLLDIREVKEITSRIRNIDKNVPIIVGGPLVYNSYLLFKLKDDANYDTDSPKGDYFFINDALNYSEYIDIDLFVIEERGEKTLVEVVNRIKAKRDPKEVNNLAFYKENELIFTKRVPEEVDLNENLISWDTIDEKLLPVILPVQLSTGCLFRCKFCNFAPQRQFLFKNKETIRQELKLIKERKRVKFIRFADDAMNPKQMQDLCEVMIEEKIEIPWTSFIRADTLNDKTVSLLRASNCHTVQLGLESGDSRILKNMNKSVTVERYMDSLACIDKAGINVQAYFIIGFPGETEETIENTIRFLNSIPTSNEGIFEFAIAPFFFLPLSPIYEKREREIYNLNGYFTNWSHNTMNSQEAMKYIPKVFLSVQNDVFFGYVGDAINSNILNKDLKEIKRIRQMLQQNILRGVHPEKIEKLWKQLENVVAR